PNPVLITTILNAVAQRYVEVAAQLNREKLTQLTKILEDQLTTAKRNLDSAETALQGFRTRTITLPSDQAADRKAAADTRDPIRTSFFDMAVERIDRKSTRLNSSHVAISYAVFCLKKKKLRVSCAATSL